MAADITPSSRWDELYQDDRFRTVWPSEHVIRFLHAHARNYDRALDIGCGAGRHMRIREPHVDWRGVDASQKAVDMAFSPHVQRADMGALPFRDNTFQIAISYGVFYYGSRGAGDDAVSEMLRVLKPRGHGFVNARTTRDWRNGADMTGEPEEGMPMHFLAQEDIPFVYGAFSDIFWELTETTTHGLSRINSDWLITVRK